jgi:hypothetical protein
VRGELYAASTNRKRIIGQWIKARDAEGEVAKIAVPEVPVWTRLGPRMRQKGCGADVTLDHVLVRSR